MFSEGKAPVDVVIALDIPADEVRATYREFWELKRMHKLVEVYDQVKYSLRILIIRYQMLLIIRKHDIFWTS